MVLIGEILGLGPWTNSLRVAAVRGIMSTVANFNEIFLYCIFFLFNFINYF